MKQWLQLIWSIILMVISAWAAACCFVQSGGWIALGIICCFVIIDRLIKVDSIFDEWE